MPIFVVQEHAARRLHYDFRLELDGVLKSWAVPKTPPLEKGVKRLAIQTEDHALEYADFSGVIPKGFYGAGTVRIWDKGNFELVERTPAKIVFRLRGKKMRGEYAVVRFEGARHANNWLLLKTR